MTVVEDRNVGDLKEENCDPCKISNIKIQNVLPQAGHMRSISFLMNNIEQRFTILWIQQSVSLKCETMRNNTQRQNETKRRQKQIMSQKRQLLKVTESG